MAAVQASFVTVHAAARCCTTPRALLPTRLPARRRVAAAVQVPKRAAAGSRDVVARRRTTTCGLTLFSPPVLSIGWAFGAWKMWQGFGRTTYTDTLPVKLALCALWCENSLVSTAHCCVLTASACNRPLLFAVSGAYRENFKRAL